MILAVEAGIGFVQMLALTLLYGLRSSWRHNAAGWVLLGSFAIKAVIFGMILLGRFTDGLGLVPWIVAMGLFDLVQFGWLVLVIREQRRTMRECAAPDDRPLI